MPEPSWITPQFVGSLLGAAIGAFASIGIWFLSSRHSERQKRTENALEKNKTRQFLRYAFSDLSSEINISKTNVEALISEIEASGGINSKVGVSFVEERREEIFYILAGSRLHFPASLELTDFFIGAINSSEVELIGMISSSIRRINFQLDRVAEQSHRFSVAELVKQLYLVREAISSAQGDTDKIVEVLLQEG